MWRPLQVASGRGHWLCSRLRPDVRDRQTSDRRQTSDAHRRLMLPTLGAGSIIKTGAAQFSAVQLIK